MQVIENKEVKDLGMTDRQLFISTGSTVKDNKLNTNSYTWNSFIDSVKEPIPLNISVDDYNKLNKVGRNTIKDKGYFILGGFNEDQIRVKENLLNREGLTLDYDGITHDEMLQVIEDMKKADFNYLLYSSASYTGSNGKIRIVIPFNKPIDPKDYKQVATNFVHASPLPKNIDPASFVISQAFHKPSYLKGVNPIIEYQVNKNFLNPDDFIKKIPGNYYDPTKGTGTTNKTITTISKDEAIKMMDSYIENEKENLIIYEPNFLSAFFTIVKSYQSKEIDEDTARILLEMLSMDNEEWKVNNLKMFDKQKDSKVKTESTFSKKFGFYLKKEIEFENEYDTANYLINELDMCYYNQHYFFKLSEHGKYIDDERLLESIVWRICGKQKTRYIKEVIDQMKSRCRTIEEGTVFEIKFNNGYLKNGKFIFERSTKFSPYSLDIDYDPYVKPVKVVDDYINHLTDSNEDYMKLLFEILGHTLIVDPEFKRMLGKFFIFIGDGGNGKGTLLEVITKILQDKNVTHLSAKQLPDDRYKIQMKGKLANLGDDLEKKHLNDEIMQAIKNISTCDSISARELYKQSENARFTCSLIFTTNHLLKTYEKGHAVQRRIMWLPMFGKVEEKDKDPLFITKLTSEESLKYWTKLIIDGYMRLYKNARFTKSNAVEEYNDSYHKLNNPALEYITYRNVDEFHEKTIKNINEDYKLWCENNGVFYSVSMLKEVLENELGLEQGWKRINGSNTRVYKKK